MSLELIVCQTPSGVIGSQGGLPWDKILDAKVFRKHTLGKVCVMGRRTWESLPGPLPDRCNVVISSKVLHDKPKSKEGFYKFSSISKVLDMFSGTHIIFIGGVGIYREAMDLVDRMYITTTYQEYEGDTYFPEIKKHEWMVHRDYYKTSEFSCSIWDRHPFPELVA